MPLGAVKIEPHGVLLTIAKIILCFGRGTHPADTIPNQSFIFWNVHDIVMLCISTLFSTQAVMRWCSLLVTSAYSCRRCYYSCWFLQVPATFPLWRPWRGAGSSWCFCCKERVLESSLFSEDVLGENGETCKSENLGWIVTKAQHSIFWIVKWVKQKNWAISTESTPENFWNQRISALFMFQPKFQFSRFHHFHPDVLASSDH